MFTLLLDLRIQFVPPMNQFGRGVVLTRELHLPFPAWDGLCIFSKQIDECPGPMGMVLKDVVWDMDRQVFLATTRIEQGDIPLALIADELRAWVERGWQVGSHEDYYAIPEAVEGIDEDTSEPSDAPDEWEEADKEAGKSWRARSPATNRVFRAMIRHLAETYDNDDAAYAWDRTGRYFDDGAVERRQAKDPHVKEFAEAVEEYRKMSEAAKASWRKRVLRYPTLESLIRLEE